MIRFVLSLALTLFATISFAQGGGTEYLYSPNENSVQGFRLGIMKGIYDGEVSVGSLSASDDFPQILGIKAGYAKVTPGAIGFLGNLTVNLMDPEGSADSFEIYRVDGNVSYGFAVPAYVYGGLNIAMISEDGFDTGFGFQVGGGYQFHPNFGVDLSYTSTTFGLENSSADFTLSGLEVALMFSF